MNHPQKPGASFAEKSTIVKFFRTKYLLFPKFQLALLGVNLLTIFVCVGVLWYQASSAFGDLRAVSGLTGPEAEFYRKYLDYHYNSFQVSMTIGFVFATSLCVVATLVISHRFSGPLVNLKRFFETIGKGSRPFPRLKFRRGDYLSDLPGVINQAIDRLESDKAEDRKAG